MSSVTLPHFGRFVLRRLLGRGARTLTGLAFHPDWGQEVVLTVGRHRLNAEQAAAWRQHAQRVARVQDPGLAPVLQADVSDGWPYVAQAREQYRLLYEWVERQEPMRLTEVVRLVAEASSVLGVLHGAQRLHGDVGLRALALSPEGRVRVYGAGAAAESMWRNELGSGVVAGMDRLEFQSRQGQEVRAVGLLLHRLLMGRVLPCGEDLADAAALQHWHLEWREPLPYRINDPLKALAAKSLAMSPQEGFLSARSLGEALAAWRDDAREDTDWLSQLDERTHGGLWLPRWPGSRPLVDEVCARDAFSHAELVSIVLMDPGLASGLLQGQGTADRVEVRDAGAGGVSRALALIGTQGLKALVDHAHVTDEVEPAARRAGLEALYQEAALAAAMAEELCPWSGDAETVSLAAMLSLLSRMVVSRHFPEEWAQIERLSGVQGEDVGWPREAEESAARLVMGMDLQELTQRLVQRLGWGQDALRLLQAHPRRLPVKAPEDRTEELRVYVGLALDLCGMARLEPGPRADQWLQQVMVRWGRAVVIERGMLLEACQRAQSRLARPLAVCRSGLLVLEQPRLDEAVPSRPGEPAGAPDVSADPEAWLRQQLAAMEGREG